MFASYLKIAVSKLLKHRLFSLVNILGFAVGLTCTTLIGLFVLDELSYDRFFRDAHRIYRVSRDYYPAEFRSSGRYPASINAPFGPQLQADFAQIARNARLMNQAPLLGRTTADLVQQSVSFVDPAFTNIFSFDWVEGDPATALRAPNSLVLTESVARRYFGTDASVLGEQMLLSFEEPLALRVSGVIRDLPQNTHLALEALSPLSTLTAQFGEGMLQNWDRNTDFHTYIQLEEDADIAALASQFPAFMARHVDAPENTASGITAMPITDIHLRSTRAEELKAPGKIANVYAFTAIAFGILLIACVNFMNLSTARSAQRAREIGMRKAIGAERSQLVRQFLGESVFLAGVAMVLALVTVELLLPWFRAFTGKEFAFASLQEKGMLGGLALLTIGAGLVAGSYPALFLSAFRPAAALRGETTRGRAGARLRQVLVVLQFAVAIALLAGTAVIYAQMRYARAIDLGIDREQVVVMGNYAAGGLGEQWPAMKQQWLAQPGVTSVSASHYTPFTHDDNGMPLRAEQGSTVNHTIKYMAVDFGFFETYGIPLVAGRYFDEARGVDRLTFTSETEATGNFIMNESAARLLGWTAEEAVDRLLWIGEDLSFQVVGVVRDSYFESLATPIKPMVFFVGSSVFTGLTPPLRMAALKVSGENLPATLAGLDATWNRFFPDIPSNRHFLDADFAALYAAEEQQAEMLGYFAALAIIVACLGLYGLASFNAERRTKEIGVRKVMGSSVWAVVVLLTNDFSRLVLLSNLIAWPVAYFAMNRWLEGFAYRIDLTPMIFVGSGLIALCIAWVTVGGTAAKAASAKPVLALRYE